jgi:hypothetical protein
LVRRVTVIAGLLDGSAGRRGEVATMTGCALQDLKARLLYP